MTGRARSTRPSEPPKENTLELLTLFVYGTLKIGYWNHDPFCGGALEIREARIPEPEPEPGPGSEPTPGTPKTTLRLAGSVPPEMWNRLGTKVLTKLRSGDDLSVGFEFSVSVDAQFAQNMEAELQQILGDLGLGDQVRVERS